MHSRLRAPITLLAACLLLAVPTVAAAADGDPVAGFTPVVTSIDATNGESGFSVAAQADGKFVMVGTNWGDGQSFLVQRYLADGTPDVTFGNGGTATGTIGNSATDVAIQADGKIVVTGYENDALVARYLANGTPDLDFGTDGIVTLGPGSVASVAVQTDGKLVLVGFDGVGNSEVTRLHPDGTLDSCHRDPVPDDRHPPVVNQP